MLNIGQFLHDQETEGGWGEPHWFVAYSHVLQRVGEAARGRKWDAWQESLEVKVSPLVHAFWHKTDVDLMRASIKHCWGPTPGPCTIRETTVLPLTSSPTSMSWLFAAPPVRHGMNWCGHPRQRLHEYPPKQSLAVTVRAKRWILAP